MMNPEDSLNVSNTKSEGHFFGHYTQIYEYEVFTLNDVTIIVKRQQLRLKGFVKLPLGHRSFSFWLLKTRNLMFTIEIVTFRH